MKETLAYEMQAVFLDLALRTSWWVALTWSIWNHRNRIIFANDSPNTSKILDDAIFFCWSWLRNLEKGFNNPFHQWSSHIREGFSN